MCCTQRIAERGGLFHVVFRAYVEYVRDRVGAVPVLIPPAFDAGSRDDLFDLLSGLDGLLLPGSPSNVGVRTSAEGASETAAMGLADPGRDHTAMVLLNLAVELDVPTLGRCRGCQEINVACGGSLEIDVHNLPGRLDHRAKPVDRPRDKYNVVHTIAPREGSLLAAGLSSADITGDIYVNSLHSQAIAQPGRGVEVEANAPDGTVEAIRVAGSGFIYGVQWHIEWGTGGADGIVTELFRTACGERMRSRLRLDSRH